MVNLIFNFCPLVVDFSTVSLIFEKNLGKLFYVYFLLIFDLFRKRGRYWVKKSRKHTPEVNYTVKIELFGVLNFFGNFVITVIIFGNLTKKIFSAENYLSFGTGPVTL